MKQIHRLFIFFPLFLALGCTGPKITQDFDPSIDFSRLNTYQWRLQEDKKPENSLVDERLHSAIDNALKEKGYQRIYSGRGDFSVSYQYRITKNFDSPSLHTGVGVGGSSSGVFGGIGLGAIDFGDRRDEATLTINIWDAISGRLIWQGEQHPAGSAPRRCNGSCGA